MTLLIASVFADTVADADAGALQAGRAGADMVELRMDSFGEPRDTLSAYLKKNHDRAWLLTCRSRAEGGHFGGDGLEGANLALATVEGTNAWVDVEFGAWGLDREIQSRVLQHLEAYPSARLILSHHAAEVPNQPVSDLIERMLAIHPRAVAKVAYPARHIIDSFIALDAMKRFGPRVIAVAMGEPGSWTRLLAPKLGSFATFAAVDRCTAAGQWSLQDYRNRFHWPRISKQTRIFGVAGDPVAHSAGPDLFNHWFAHHAVDGLYLPICIGTNRGGIAEFLNECRKRPWLDLAGLSITIPHKEAACRWAGDAADPMSREIGAANCVVFGHDSYAAYNTDSYAAVDSLAASLSCHRSSLRETRVDVLGSGGSARAICHGLSEMGCQITVYARNPRKAGDFERWGARVRDWSERLSGNGEVLVNCTPLGMWPRTGESPMSPDALIGRKLVFDLVYRPLETRLLAEAKAAGVPILSGLDMFVRQASTQIALWTGNHPDIESAKAWLHNRLEPGPSRPRQSIALVGARGSGKTTVAAMVATKLNLPHYDTDAMVVAEAGRSIREIFESEGEAGFRKRESQAIRFALQSGPAVISLGGGSLLDPQNRQAIREAARVIWLKAPAETLAARLRDDCGTHEQRPPLIAGVSDPSIESEHVLRVREPIYRDSADETVETKNLNASEVAQWIIDKVIQYAWT